MDSERLPNWPLAFILLLALLLAAGAPALAADNSLRLKCAWELSQDLKTGLVQRVSGEQMLLFKSMGGSYGQIVLDGMPTPFPASFSDTYLKAEVRYKSGTTPMTETLEINRYTGGIRKWLRWGESGSLYQGKCTKVTGALF